MIHAAGRGGRMHALRLIPGEDLRATLHAWAQRARIEAAGIVSAVGSCSRACLRFAGRSEGTVIEGDLEICSLSGTLARHGLHLHLVIADAEGRTTGGHLLDGCIVRTTLELIVQEVDGVQFLRTPDAGTGYLELDPRVTG
ncbi:MAG TPA: DUF296 domain-containing protein [Flavobacteriales bacterium]|nr:DUF296 domain-containing protein [Flavobacteriales bacterium]